MTVSDLKEFLLYCLIINYGIIIVWFLVFRFGHAWMFNLHSRWFSLSEASFDALQYAGMSVYKIGILLFNLVPYIALLIIDV